MNELIFIRNLIPTEKRTLDEVREHYQVERELADRLRASSQAERHNLYTEVYEELFRRIPHHQQLTSAVDRKSRHRRLGWQIALLKRFLRKDQVFFEIGGGDCALSIEVAPLVAKSIGCDVASCLSSGLFKPNNFSFLQTDGRTFDLEDESVDVAYSNQLMEHLHVDDAQAQLKEIFRVLKQGGYYVCVTPNRIGGPWDISMYFDKQATGFHMKEYTVGELLMMFQNLGCSGVNVYGGGKGIFCRLPVGFVRACERLLQKFPDAISIPLARSLPGRAVLGIRIVAVK